MFNGNTRRLFGPPPYLPGISLGPGVAEQPAVAGNDCAARHHHECPARDVDRPHRPHCRRVQEEIGDVLPGGVEERGNRHDERVRQQCQPHHDRDAARRCDRRPERQGLQLVRVGPLKLLVPG